MIRFQTCSSLAVTEDLIERLAGLLSNYLDLKYLNPFSTELKRISSIPVAKKDLRYLIGFESFSLKICSKHENSFFFNFDILLDYLILHPFCGTIHVYFLGGHLN